MIGNPHEPKPASPLEAAPRMALLRGQGHSLPPIGTGRHHDAAHHSRQRWTGALLALLLFGGTLVGVIGMELGWWSRW